MSIPDKIKEKYSVENGVLLGFVPGGITKRMIDTMNSKSEQGEFGWQIFYFKTDVKLSSTLLLLPWNIGKRLIVKVVSCMYFQN